MDETIKTDERRLLTGRFSVPLIRRMAERKGYDVLENSVDGNFVKIEKGNKSLIICDMPLNLNSAASAKLCQDKLACADILNQLGYKVPKCKYFIKKHPDVKDIKEAILNAIKNIEEDMGITYPLILKPNNLSQGSGVHRINKFDEAEAAIDNILSLKSKVILLQECCIGKEYRVVVLGKGSKIIQAYERIPFTIFGDGSSTIKDLLNAKYLEFAKAKRDKNINVNDERILKAIHNNGYTIDTILPNKQSLQLQEIANLSLGGTSRDVKNLISPYFQKICKNVARQLDLDLCGIDIIADDLTDFNNKKYSIIEINSAPGLDNYLYEDKQQQEEYVESLYQEVFDYKTKDFEQIDNNNLDL